MKVRIKGNSVRYRLSKSEVAKFGEVGALAETTETLGETFCYQLLRAPVETLTVHFHQNTLTFSVPLAIAQTWVQTEEIGFSHKLQLPNGTEVYLLLEKDFVCIDNTFEDQSDNYPNPNAAC